jgi:hypothetical protein
MPMDHSPIAPVPVQATVMNASGNPDFDGYFARTMSAPPEINEQAKLPQAKKQLNEQARQPVKPQEMTSPSQASQALLGQAPTTPSTHSSQLYHTSPSGQPFVRPSGGRPPYQQSKGNYPPPSVPGTPQVNAFNSYVSFFFAKPILLIDYD